MRGGERRAAMLVGTAFAVSALLSGCGIQRAWMPTCSNGDALILVLQSVPSAAYTPCIKEFPTGWTFGGESIRRGESEFWLDSDRAGPQAVTVTLTRGCDVAAAVRVPTEPDEIGLQRYEEPQALPPHFSGNRYYLFSAGCITYRFRFQRGTPFLVANDATSALTFLAREEAVRELAKKGLTLCGAGARCPG